jgi:hypothetical protein
MYVPMHLDDGITPNPDAVFLPNSPKAKAKFAEEARGLFGVCMVKDPVTGIVRGEKIIPFDYTGCNIVGGPKYQVACEQRFLEVQVHIFRDPLPPPQPPHTQS